jgi:ATP-binding cassette subfamily B protein
MAQETFLEEDYSSRMNLGIWRKLLRYVRPYYKHLGLLLLFCGVTAVCENLFPLVTRQVIDTVNARLGDPTVRVPLALYGLEYLALTVGLCGSVWAFIYVAGFIATSIGYDIRKAAFARLQELSFSYYDRRPVGWLVARLTSDSDRLSNIIAWGCTDVLWSFWMLVAATAIILSVNWQLALLLLAIVPPLAWISLFFKKRLLAASREVRKTNSKITAAYSEAMAGIRTTKTLTREQENIAEFKEVTGAMYGYSVRNAVLGALYLPIVITLGSVGTALALWAGGYQVLSGAITIGTLVMFFSYAGQLIWPIAEAARVFSDMQAAQAAAERVLDLLETEPEIKDSPEVAAALARFAGDPPAGLAADGYPDHIGDIEFQNVGFAYQHGKPVLENFSFKVATGTTVALVGPTGGGKTTIVSLLCRFYEPTAGCILIGGVDYRRRSLHWLQSHLGIVLQTPHLFKGTVRENIRYGHLAANDEEITRVARLVNAHDFIVGLEKGYDTDVGEGGNRLSLGQKQLVSLARVLLADPQILVMDEATSSVDTQTEQLIQAGVEKMLKGRTSFVIAHRLSTIRSADRIVVIDGGRCVEEGTHGELIRRRGRYYELYTNQFTQEKEEELLRADAPPATA